MKVHPRCVVLHCVALCCVALHLRCVALRSVGVALGLVRAVAVLPKVGWRRPREEGLT